MLEYTKRGPDRFSRVATEVSVALVLILAEKETGARLNNLLLQDGYQTSLSTEWDDALLQLEEQPVDLLLVRPTPPDGAYSPKPPVGLTGERNAGFGGQLKEGLRRLREVRDIPAIAVVPEQRLGERDWLWNVNDFVVEPYRNGELLARLHRLLGPGGGEGQNLIVAGDLLIDGDKYQVHLANRPLSLTFKEFELLRFLSSHPGKVFSRQTLLNQVWGYDYFGGERTVDVHIRRLRSKIEDRNHSFIDTVRNVGYRFKT
ncbi:MAG: response regulator transcription factor [Chloroflexi bacterium]|nr:response regulator transcription factor [Chloroflexota bacterium]